jgi:hypothetical protein
MRMATTETWAPPSLTLPHKGGGDDVVMSPTFFLIPSPLRGEGKGGGGAAPQPLPTPATRTRP